MVNRRELARRNEAIALASRALKDGSLAAEDPQLAKLLAGIEDYVELADAGGDYYYPAAAKRKSDREAGRVFLVAEPRQHDMGQHPLTHRAISATQQMHERGGPLVNAPDKGPAIERMRELLSKYVMPTSISGIGGGGARDTRTPEELLDVAASLMVDTDRGFNSRAGYAYGGMPLDAGHIIGHASRPDLSNKGSNLEWENQYANKGKAATEKMAANQGREATDEELAAGLFKSHVNKLTKDVVLPGRKGSKERNEFMAPIHQKLADAETARAQQYKDNYVRELTSIDGEPLEDGAGVGHTSGNEGKVVKLNVNTQGGDFHLDTEMRKRKMA